MTQKVPRSGIHEGVKYYKARTIVRRCKCCGDFYLISGGRGKKPTTCSPECKKKLKNEYNKKYGREWRENNPEYGKEWRERNPDYLKDWRRENDIKVIEYNKKWHPITAPIHNAKRDPTIHAIREKDRYNALPPTKRNKRNKESNYKRKENFEDELKAIQRLRREIGLL